MFCLNGDIFRVLWLKTPMEIHCLSMILGHVFVSRSVGQSCLQHVFLGFLFIIFIFLKIYLPGSCSLLC